MDTAISCRYFNSGFNGQIRPTNVSISNKTSYRKISQSREIDTLCQHVALQFDRRVDTLKVSGWTLVNTYFASLHLARFYDKTSYWNGPRSPVHLDFRLCLSKPRFKMTSTVLYWFVAARTINQRIKLDTVIIWHKFSRCIWQSWIISSPTFIFLSTAHLVSFLTLK